MICPEGVRPLGSKNFAKLCSFRSDRACRGVALAKMGHPSEKFLMGNAPSISQPVRVSPCGSVANKQKY